MAVHSPVNGTTAIPWRRSRSRQTLLEQLKECQEAWCPRTPWDRDEVQAVLSGTPTGSFLVLRDPVTSQPSLLCVSAGEQNEEILQRKIQCRGTVFQLCESRLSFSDLTHLVLFYSLTRDVLPFCLVIPCWIYSLTKMNEDHLTPLEPKAWLFTPPELQTEEMTNRELSNVICSIQLTSTNGALCIINPLYLHEHGDDWLTHRTAAVQSSIYRRDRRLSTTRTWAGSGLQNKRALSLEQESSAVSPEGAGLVRARSADSSSAQPTPTEVVLRRASKDFLNTAPQRGSTGNLSISSTPGITPPELHRHSSPVLQGPHRVSWIEDGFWLPPPRPLSLLHPPSLELDSLSISSIEEEQDTYIPSPSSHSPQPHRLANKVINRLSAVGQALGGLVCQKKRLTNRVQELSERKGRAFAEAVKGFVDMTLKGGTDPSGVTGSEFLQEVRSSLTSLREILLDCPDIQAILDSMNDLNDLEIESLVELSLHKVALKPVSAHLYSCIHTSRTNDGSFERLQSNFLVLEKNDVQEMGGSAGVGVPDSIILERIQQRWHSMHEVYSPNKKIQILLKVCKSIYHSMSANSSSGTVFGADDFLPCLTWVLLRSNLVALQVDTDYMMELLDPTQLQGEGGYYLTTLYASLYYISSFRPRLAARQLSMEAQNSINQWHRRRTLYCDQARRSKHRQTIRRQSCQDRSKQKSKTETGCKNESGSCSGSVSEQQTIRSSEAPQTLWENAQREEKHQDESQSTAPISNGQHATQQEVMTNAQEDGQTLTEELQNEF